MARYLLDRMAQSVAVLAIMSVVIFWLMGLMPGDPIDLMISADPRLTPEDAARLRELHGLDLPISERYLNWLTAALSGDLGFSRLFAMPVLEAVLPALGNTVLLLGISFVLAVAIAFLSGIVAAMNQHRKLDYAINLLAFAAISIPSFWLALMMITLFSVTLGWLPASGTESVGGGGFPRQGAVSGPARPHPDHRQPRLPHPICPRVDDRNPAPGLYSDRPGQGGR